MKIKGKILVILLLAFLVCTKSAYAVDINKQDNTVAYEVGIDEDFDDVIGNASSSVYDFGEYSYLLAAGKAYIKDYRGTEEVLNIPSMLNGYQVIGLYSECFGNSKNLKVVNIPSSVKSIYIDTFVNCKTLEQINVDESNTTYASEDGILYSKDYEYFVTVPEGRKGIVNVKSGVKYICDCSLLNVSKVTQINVPASVFDIGERAFFDTSSLQKINIDSSNEYFVFDEGILYNKDKSEVIKCVDTRTSCVTLPSSVKYIRSYAFYNCNKMVGPLTLSKKLATIGEWAFAHCSSLDGKVALPGSLYVMDRSAFYNCNKIESVVFSAGLSEIPADAFAYCSGLKEIKIPDNITRIGERAFFYCDNVTNINLGNGVDSIGAWAFDYNTSLTGDLVIPDSVTSIGTGAFMHSPNINGLITIGKNVEEIGDSIIYDSNNAKGVVFTGNAPTVTDYSFTEPNISYYYPNMQTGYDNLIIDKNLIAYDEKPIVNFYVNDEIIDTIVQPIFGRTISQIDLSEIEKDYYFEGWYTTPSFTKEFTFDTPIMKNTNLYGKVIPKNVLKFRTEEFIAEIGLNYTLDLNYTLEQGATYDDIVWSSSDESVIQINEDGTIMALTKGEAIITASYKNVSASIKVIGFKDENALSFTLEEMTVEIGDVESLSLDYHLINNGKYENIEWKSSDQEIATVENGVLTALAKGQIVITASYEDVQDNILINVLEPNRIDIVSSDISIKENKVQALDLDYFFNDGATTDDIIWESSDSSIAYVENGILHAVSAGDVVITANYKKAKDYINVSVHYKDSIAFEQERVRVVISDELYELQYVCFSIDDNSVVLTSSNEDVAVIENGKLRLKSFGETIITATYGEATDTLIVTVVPPNRLMFLEESISVEYRKNSNLNYTIDYAFEDGGAYEDIVFESEDENVVKIIDNIPVIAGVGNTNLTIKYKDLIDTIPVTVISIDTLSFKRSGYLVKRGEKINIDYFFDSYEEDPQNITFSSQDNNVARLVDHTLYGIGLGKTTITARYKDIEDTITILVIDEDWLLGDLDFNGVVNGTDASIALDIYNKDINDEVLNVVGDMDFNGVVNATDASMIMDIYNRVV